MWLKQSWQNIAERIYKTTTPCFREPDDVTEILNQYYVEKNCDWIKKLLISNMNCRLNPNTSIVIISKNLINEKHCDTNVE